MKMISLILMLGVLLGGCTYKLQTSEYLIDRFDGKIEYTGVKVVPVFEKVTIPPDPNTICGWDQILNTEANQPIIQQIFTTTITNLDSAYVELIIERCVLVTPDGISHRLLTGQVRTINDNQIQPNLGMLPGSVIAPTLWPQDLITAKGRLVYLFPPCVVQLGLAFRGPTNKILYNFYEIKLWKD